MATIEDKYRYRALTEAELLSGMPMDEYLKDYKGADGHYCVWRNDERWLSFDVKGGKVNGVRLLFDPSGTKLRSLCEMKDGVPNGAYVEYYLDGSTKVRANYSDGRFDGLYTRTDRKGNVIHQYRYSSGKKVEKIK